MLELQRQLRSQRSSEGNNDPSQGQSTSQPQSPTSGHERGQRRTVNRLRSDSEAHTSSPKPSTDVEPLQCRGILTTSTSGAGRHFYGLSSLHNLVHGLRKHLHLTYGWTYAEEDLHPKPITLSFATPSAVTAAVHPTLHQTPTDYNDGVFMGKEQEEECLRLFWQSYHGAIPILDERSFRDHHASLWNDARRLDQYREDSALVDIVLAICVQYGTTHIQQGFEPLDADSQYSVTDPSNAGRWYFQRSHSLLKGELHSPSVMLLQCQIFSVVYLRDASILEMALSTLAGAVQTAYALGLHMDAKECSNVHEQELLKRLFCMVYVLDGKMSMDCGRPSLVHKFGTQLPRDGHELASSSVEMFVPSSRLKATWLAYHRSHVDMIRSFRQSYSLVYDNIAHLLLSRDGESFGVDAELVRRCDGLLAEQLDILKQGLKDVPNALKYDFANTTDATRREYSQPDTQHHDPIWLQRQRVMLRLLYHDNCISICRPFLILPSPEETVSMPTRGATECLHHSISITDIVFRILHESDILHGWHRAYQFQWNAAIYMIAFAFGNLTSDTIDTIGTKLEQATLVLESFGRCFAVARSATEVVRDLHGKLRSACAQNMV